MDDAASDPAADPPRPLIDLTRPRLFCLRHGEPFRAQWPLGFPRFGVYAMDRLLHDPAFAAELGGTLSGESVGAALDRTPACCRLGRDAMLELYHRCGIGVGGACVNCFAVRLGAPYMTMLPNGRVKKHRHICFECVLDRMRPH